MLHTTTWVKVKMKYVEPNNIFDRHMSQFYNCLLFWGWTGVDRQTARHICLSTVQPTSVLTKASV